jgi:hypothetical protein
MIYDLFTEVAEEMCHKANFPKIRGALSGLELTTVLNRIIGRA